MVFAARAALLRVASLRQLLLAAKGFGAFPHGIGRRVFILSNSGGPGVLCTDEAARRGSSCRPCPPRWRRGSAPTCRRRRRSPIPSIFSPTRARSALPRRSRPRCAKARARSTRSSASMSCPSWSMPGRSSRGSRRRRPSVGLPYLHSMMGTLPGKAEWFAAMEQAGVPTFNNVEEMAECAGFSRAIPRSGSWRGAEAEPLAPRPLARAPGRRQSQAVREAATRRRCRAGIRR